VPRLLFSIFNRGEKAPDAESNYNELFLTSRRRFILHYYKVKRLALGRKNPSQSSQWQRQVPALELQSQVLINHRLFRAVLPFEVEKNLPYERSHS